MAKITGKTRIAEFIRTRRKQRGLTQQELADHAEVSFTFVNRVENGDLKVQVNTLNKILNVFGYEIGPMQISASVKDTSL